MATERLPLCEIAEIPKRLSPPLANLTIVVECKKQPRVNMSTGRAKQPVWLEDKDILAAVFEHVAVGVVVCDAEGYLVYVSPEAERILGVGLRHVNSAEWSAIYGCYLPDGLTPYPQEKLPLTRAMQGEDAPHELIFIKNSQRPEGLWIDASGMPLRDVEGTLCGGVVVFSDVSVPQNLLRSEGAVGAVPTAAGDPSASIPDGHDQVSERFSRFRTMYLQLARAVEQTADSVVITDSRATIEYVNPAFEKITGYSLSEVLGRTPSVLKSGKHDAEFYRKLWGKLTSGESFHGTIINRKKSGELFWAEQTITPIKDEAGRTTHFVSLLKDMTALRKKQEQEFHMSMARELQQRYYNTTASLPGFDIAGAAFPADMTGGDYFDFIPQDDGALLIVIADIAGHGFGSAITMAEVRASLRSYATMVSDVPSLLKCINRSLDPSVGGLRFVTMFLGRIDAQKRSLEYASAGHEYGYLLRSSGDIGAVLDSTALPLGVLPDLDFGPARVVPLDHGDTILLLTDGITESTNADDAEFGTEEALDLVRHHQQLTARELVQELYQATRRFAGSTPQTDDITSVICKVE